MTRIIGGAAKGRRLRTPTGSATRPTSDRVREALFSVLEARVGSLVDHSFLDLYAGSGAVGLEAASRGATRVVLVEQDRRTAAIAQDNARLLGLPGVRVLSIAVDRLLSASAGGPGAGSGFDIAFLDPPYALTDEVVGVNVSSLLAGGWLSEGGLVVVERATRDLDWVWPPGFEPVGEKKYGETTLVLGTVTECVEPPAPDPSIP